MCKDVRIPKEIVDKISLRNRLNNEIEDWCTKNIDMDGMDSAYAEIVQDTFGDEQCVEGRKEWCEQYRIGEDTYTGDYFWETECPGQYLHMKFYV